MPGVVVERAAADDVLLVDVGAELPVEQGEHVREAIEAEDPPDAEERHPAAHLDRLDARAVHRLDHRRVVALLEQLLGSPLAGVRARDVLEGGGGDAGRFVPGDADPVVRAPLRRVHRRRSVGVPREAVVGPLLEPLADHRCLHAPVAVEAAAEDQALLADPRVPAVGGLPAVDVGRLAVSIGRADADDDPVLHVGAEKAVVRVVRRAGEDEGRVVGELVAVDLLPVAVGHHAERVARDHRRRAGRGLRLREELRRPDEVGERSGGSEGERAPEQRASGDPPVRALVGLPPVVHLGRTLWAPAEGLHRGLHALPLGKKYG